MIMNKELFDFTVELECAAKLAGIQTKYGREDLARKTMHQLYGKLILKYEEGLP